MGHRFISPLHHKYHQSVTPTTSKSLAKPKNRNNPPSQSQQCPKTRLESLSQIIASKTISPAFTITPNAQLALILLKITPVVRYVNLVMWPTAPSALMETVSCALMAHGLIALKSAKLVPPKSMDATTVPKVGKIVIHVIPNNSHHTQSITYANVSKEMCMIWMLQNVLLVRLKSLSVLLARFKAQVSLAISARITWTEF